MGYLINGNALNANSKPTELNCQKYVLENKTLVATIVISYEATCFKAGNTSLRLLKKKAIAIARS